MGIYLIKHTPDTHFPAIFLKDPLHIVKAAGDYGKSGRWLWRICTEVIVNPPGGYRKSSRRLSQIQPEVMANPAGG